MSDSQADAVGWTWSGRPRGWDAIRPTRMIAKTLWAGRARAVDADPPVPQRGIVEHPLWTGCQWICH